MLLNVFKSTTAGRVLPSVMGNNTVRVRHIIDTLLLFTKTHMKIEKKNNDFVKAEHHKMTYNF